MIEHKVSKKILPLYFPSPQYEASDHHIKKLIHMTFTICKTLGCVQCMCFCKALCHYKYGSFNQYEFAIPDVKFPLREGEGAKFWYIDSLHSKKVKTFINSSTFGNLDDYWKHHYFYIRSLIITRHIVTQLYSLFEIRCSTAKSYVLGATCPPQQSSINQPLHFA